MPSRLVLVCAAVVAGCSGADAAPPDEAPSFEVGRAGITLVLPESWRTLPIEDGIVTDPQTRVAVASGPLREPIPGCQTQITRYAPRPGGAAVVVVEWQRSVDARPPPRPAHLGAVLPLRPGDLECFAADGGTVQFVEHRRVFGVYAMIGARADERLRAEVRRTVDTLRVEPRG
jgi:hypothetical protein